MRLRGRERELVRTTLEELVQLQNRDGGKLTDLIQRILLLLAMSFVLRKHLGEWSWLLHRWFLGGYG